MREIERKFLVSDDTFRREAFRSTHIAQGYLCSRRVTARVRIRGEEAFLTIKGKSHDGGLSRFEWERPIPVRCAEQLLRRCRGVVEKVRYEVRHGDHIWEVDCFEGDNEGLVVAEVELRATDEQPVLPAWIWKEVTGVRYYHNSFLARCPYKSWLTNLAVSK